MSVITTSADDHALSEASAELSAEHSLNRYRCPTYQIDWQDEWDCGCNDHRPQCNKEITPYASLPVATASSTASLKN